MANIDVLKAQIVRQNCTAPWGFRLQGGAQESQPLTIWRVTPGSPAARIGLKAGDEVTEIGDVPTSGLTIQDANNIIGQYGMSLILTVERKSWGAVPVNPVLTPNQAPALRSYQTYDMSGGTRHPRRPPQYQSQFPSYDFQTVQAKPYSPTEGPPYQFPPQPQPAPPAPAPEPYVPQPQQYDSYQQPAPQSPSQQQDYANYEDQVAAGTSQSKTFKVLQSLMQNEEPYAGPRELPPLRSASVEKWKEQQQMRQQGSSSPRVKVFMPQQYNSPLGMYSAGNIIDTFANQAEVQMQELEQRQESELSGAHEAVLAEDRPIYLSQS